MQISHFFILGSVIGLRRFRCCSSGDPQGDWGAGGRQGYRPEQAEQEGSHPHGDPCHEGTTASKSGQFQRGEKYI